MAEQGKCEMSDVEMDEASGGDMNLNDNITGQEISMRTNENGLNNNGNTIVEGDTDTVDILIPPILPGGSDESSGNGNESSDSKKFMEMIPKWLRSMTTGKGPYASCNPLDFCYNMTHLRRGKAIIFNHFKFDPKQNLPDRPGTEIDAAALRNTFERLGFDVKMHNDLTFTRIDEELQKAVDEDHNNSDCIAVIVMTHGKQNILHAYDISYNADSIWSRFTADKCSTLASKPKMFFVQACRGEQYDDGTDLKIRKSRTVVDGPGEKKTYKIPNQADFLTVFSTAPALANSKQKSRSFLSRLFQYLSLSNSDHFSWRSSVRGSCFIQALCRIMDEWAYTTDVLSLITMVNCEVAINYQSNVPRDVNQHQKKQVPHVSHTLTRQIRFSPPGVSSTLV